MTTGAAQELAIFAATAPSVSWLPLRRTHTLNAELQTLHIRLPLMLSSSMTQMSCSTSSVKCAKILMFAAAQAIPTIALFLTLTNNLHL
jgi:hypothetical protein